NIITEVTTEMPRSRSIAIQSERVSRRFFLALTSPASWIAPPNRRSFSVSVVLPASGCEMIAKVRRRSTSRASGVAALAAGSASAEGAATVESGWNCSFMLRCMWQAMAAGSSALLSGVARANEFQGVLLPKAPRPAALDFPARRFRDRSRPNEHDLLRSDIMLIHDRLADRGRDVVG